MAADKNITVLERQTIWDVAIQEYGSAQAVFQLLIDNNKIIDLNADITAGEALKIKSDAIEVKIQREFEARHYKPITGEIDENFNGDFNNDYLSDFYNYEQ